MDDLTRSVWGNDETRGTAIGLTEGTERTYTTICDVREGFGSIMYVIVQIDGSIFIWPKPH